MRTYLARAVTTAVLGTSFASLAGAQIGHVVGAQKVSDTAGGFAAELEEEDQFGRSIVNLGDLDGDGVTDLLVGAHTDDDGGTDKGSVYVLFLRSNGYVKAWSKISDTAGNFAGRLDLGDQFGRAACSLGDLDLDGVTDVVVSSNYDDDGGANRGAVYVLFLNVDGTVKASQKISQGNGGLPVLLKNHDEFGRSITNLGDLDGDGIQDIVVGTPEDDEGGTNTGALHFLFLNRNGTVKSYRRMSKSTEGLRLKAGDWFGFCSTSLGDFDGDGDTDIAVGSVLDDDGGFNQGSVWILRLRPDGGLQAAHEINELVGGFTAPLDDIDQFGTSIACIGDLDGNGVVDLVVGAVKDDDGGLPGNADADVGAAYVLFLEADATVKSWVKIGDTSGDLPYDLDQYDWFGSAAARLGSSPGDGLFNVAIGCRNDDDGSPNRGAIYLLQLNDGTGPVADFNASRTLGVAPLTVQFTDQSQNEVSTWLWNFSEGNQSSLRNPSRTFSAPGLYDITLTVRGPRGKDSERKVAYVEVVTGPLADFTATPTEGLAPLGVQFTDLSEGGISTWAWDFGDGTGSSERSPFHVFAPGTWTVALTVTGPSGSHTRTRSELVASIDPFPAAGFARAPGEGFAPLLVQFEDRSTGFVTSWAWDFGDGTGSSAQSPSHLYAAPGVYDVRLTASGPHGLDLHVQPGCVVVESPVPAADLAVEPESGHAPLGVRFLDRSSGDITAWQWDFGDGTTAQVRDPVHVYQDPGAYTVSLSVRGPLGTDTALRPGLVTVIEPPPTAEFQVTSTTGFAPFEVQFTDQSGGLVSAYLWDFGDGTGSSEPDPQHVYTVPGTYSVALTVSGPSGTDTLARADLVQVEDPVPVASFDAPMTSGFAPLAVQFSDTSRGDVRAWLWEFGDGTSSTERDPEHVFAAPGSYDVRLTVSGPSGSDQELRPGFVAALAQPPAADFAAPTTSGPAPLTVRFQDLSSGTLSAWSWSLGDGTSSTEREPEHVYSVPGTYAVSLTASGPAGSDTETKAGYVTVLPPAPVAEFTFGPQAGFAPLSVAFTDLSQGQVTSWLWSFGDGSTARARYPIKNYQRPGTYTATLTVKGPGGTRSIQHGPVTVLARPVLADGGFELDAAGGSPGTPWRVVAGTATVRSSLAPDGAFPREGTRWGELAALGTGPATPPSQPGGEGTLPTGAAALECALAYTPLAPHLVFDVAFLRGDGTDGFLSVDLSDGARHVNVLLADGAWPFPATSALYGTPMTAPIRRQIDLGALFPGLAGGAPLTLRVSVGDGGQGPAPARAYVDSLRLVPEATASFRNGTGRNAARYSSSPAVLGGSWTITVDTTGHAGVRGIQLVGLQRPASGLFRTSGEVLVAGKRLFAQTWPALPGINVRTVTLPVDLSLLGVAMSTQVTITGGTAELTNAFDLILGF
ncbi:MAG TPA: PKD domain-containing protein [Planctomycetota bacterium]